MEINIKENGKMVKLMDMAFIKIRMVVFMKDIKGMEKNKDKGFFSLLMDPMKMVNGKTIIFIKEENIYKK
jgi:hypothetical protein